VTIRTAPLRKTAACMAAVAFGVLCIAPPCDAGEPVPTPARVPALTALSTTSQTLLARADQAATSTRDNSKGFFKSGRGAVVLALFGVGFAYTLYSKTHDRVQSPIR
jgi:hypothetical protein